MNPRALGAVANVLVAWGIVFRATGSEPMSVSGARLPFEIPDGLNGVRTEAIRVVDGISIRA